MGKEDYASTGGTLKLKGVKDTGIKKRKKKKSKVNLATELRTSKSRSRDRSVEDTRDEEREAEVEGGKSGAVEKEDGRREEGDGEGEGGEEEGDGVYLAAKTEAERKFEERKRKRLDERLRKEGVKSHKERVEEYNKYLSSLSEHHDMPRIGPG